MNILKKNDKKNDELSTTPFAENSVSFNFFFSGAR